MQTHGEASDRSVVDDTRASTSDGPGRLGRGMPSAEYRQQIEDEIPFLRSTVRRWHRDKADADDLVQDTLVQALANAHLCSRVLICALGCTLLCATAFSPE